MVSQILQKNKRKRFILMYHSSIKSKSFLFFRSFFWRSQENKNCFRDYLTFRKGPKSSIYIQKVQDSEKFISKCRKKIYHNPVYFPCLKGKSSRQATKGKSSSKAYQNVVIVNLKVHQHRSSPFYFSKLSIFYQKYFMKLQ